MRLKLSSTGCLLPDFLNYSVHLHYKVYLAKKLPAQIVTCYYFDIRWMLPASQNTNKSQTTTPVEILALLPFSGKKINGILIQGHKTVMITRHLTPSYNCRIWQPNLSPFLNKKNQVRYHGSIHSPNKNHKGQWALIVTRSDSLQSPYIFPKGNMTGILKPFILLKRIFGLQAGEWQSLYSLFMTQHFTSECNTAILLCQNLTTQQ